MSPWTTQPTPRAHSPRSSAPAETSAVTRNPLLWGPIRGHARILSLLRPNRLLLSLHHRIKASSPLAPPSPNYSYWPLFFPVQARLQGSFPRPSLVKPALPLLSCLHSLLSPHASCRLPGSAPSNHPSLLLCTSLRAAGGGLVLAELLPEVGHPAGLLRCLWVSSSPSGPPLRASPLPCGTWSVLSRGFYFSGRLTTHSQNS